MSSIKFTMPKLRPASVFKMPKMPKLPRVSIPKMPGVLKTKTFNFSKLSKPIKMSKSPKIKIIKSVIKKLKK